MPPRRSAQIGEIFILPAVIYLLIAVPGWRVKLIRAAPLCAAFALPIVVISFRNYVTIQLSRWRRTRRGRSTAGRGRGRLCHADLAAV